MYWHQKLSYFAVGVIGASMAIEIASRSRPVPAVPREGDEASTFQHTFRPYEEIKPWAMLDADLATHRIKGDMDPYIFEHGSDTCYAFLLKPRDSASVGMIAASCTTKCVLF
jgi:hypothetical protein